jgi:hypothetical protein
MAGGAPGGADPLELAVTTDPPAGWDELAAAAATDFFSSRLFVTAYARHHPGARVLWLGARRGKRLVGGLAAIGASRCGFSSWHSLPAGTSGGPLVNPDLAGDLHDLVGIELVERFAAELRGRRVAAALNLASAADARWRVALVRRGWSHSAIPAAFIPTSGDLEHVEYSVLPKKRRNERNRGLRRGAVLGTSYDPDDAAAFYAIYGRAAGGWGGEPIPLPLIQQLLSEGQPAVFLCTVRYGGRLIGAHLNLQHGDRVTAWLGATLPEYHRELFPATLLIWQGIVECIERGCRTFDLGGHAGRTKLAEFKRHLGAETEQRGLYRRERAWWRQLRRLRSRAGGAERGWS